MGYIDPNTGGMLFQVLAVAFAALSGFVLVFSRQIRRAIARVRRFLRERSDGDESKPAGGAG
ncbi:MAG: hypothetical protein FJ026_13565 [Chloroflexi bacterium]|nr:hypothetical protein [Chloroflexota bacterium]